MSTAYLSATIYLPYVKKRVKPYISSSNIKAISDGLILTGNIHILTVYIHNRC